MFVLRQTFGEHVAVVAAVSRCARPRRRHRTVGPVRLLQALGVAAGLSGTQGVLTRQHVYSPREAALNVMAPDLELGRLLSATPPR